MNETYDVVVIGGGAAGLSGAVALARSRRSVVVIDDGKPRNAPAGHVHNFLTRDNTPPAELLAAGRDELARYGGELVDGRVAAVAGRADDFAVTLADGRAVRTRRLLVATGLLDELPDVPGLADRWGRDVLHCPYCHGWEARDQRVGVIASVHQAHLWRQLTPHVLLFLHGGPAPDAATAEALAARAVPVVRERIESLLVDSDKLSGVRLDSGAVVELDALVVAPRFVARSQVFADLGLEPADLVVDGRVYGSRIPAEATGATAVPGVWVAGNVTDLAATVIASAAAGVAAGAAINADLVAADTRAAVDEYRHQVHTMFEREAWEERYRAKPTIWSGNPNSQLVAEAADLTPGRALDVGCGEGADAVWLAKRGWWVTAVDISSTALERAATHAAQAGVDTVEFVEADLRVTPPEPASYDLVTAQYMHLPPPARAELYARLADAVAPAGTLLIVGHDPSDLHTTAHRAHFPDMMFTADDIAGALDPAAWEIVVAEYRPRTVTDAEGRDITIGDAVVVARRR